MPKLSPRLERSSPGIPTGTRDEVDALVQSVLGYPTRHAGEPDRKLVTVEVFLQRRFHPDSAPSKRTIWRWIREGRLEAVKIGKRYYLVD